MEMAIFISLDDPEVRYYTNFGNSEAYIVSPEAKRADIVQCRDCIHYQNGHLCRNFSRFGTIETEPWDFCSYGVGRDDD